jgi:biotin transport system substrate-specific component
VNNNDRASPIQGNFMTKPSIQALVASQGRGVELARQIALVVGASLFVALCARITIPLPFTPVPLTVQNFGVLLVGMLLGSKRGCAALFLYLAEGAIGLPVFNPAGPGGLAQLTGATGGFLLAYPLVAGLTGFIVERGQNSFARAAGAGLLGEVVLFTGGLTWLAVLTHSVSQALRWGLYWFVFAEVIKVMMAAALATRLRRSRSVQA